MQLKYRGAPSRQERRKAKGVGVWEKDCTSIIRNRASLTPDLRTDITWGPVKADVWKNV